VAFWERLIADAADLSGAGRERIVAMDIELVVP
jgi:hypothetical protein